MSRKSILTVLWLFTNVVTFAADVVRVPDDVYPVHTEYSYFLGQTPADILGRPVVTDQDRYDYRRIVIETEAVRQSKKVYQDVINDKGVEIRGLPGAAKFILRDSAKTNGQPNSDAVKQAMRLIDQVFRYQITDDKYHGAEYHGNFHWRSDLPPTDVNSADFTLLGLAEIFTEYKDAFPDQYLSTIEPGIRLGLDAITKRHISRAPISYTNVICLKIANLILWGEILQDESLRQSGQEYLDRFYVFTYNSGIGEFLARYMGVYVLTFDAIRSKSINPQTRKIADRLLQYGYQQLAAVFFPAQNTQISPQSRMGNIPFVMRDMDVWYYYWGWGMMSTCTFPVNLPALIPDQHTTDLAFQTAKFARGTYISKHDWQIRYWYNYIDQNYAIGCSDHYFLGTQRGLAIQLRNRKDFPTTGLWFHNDALPHGFNKSKQYNFLRANPGVVQDKNALLIVTAVPAGNSAKLQNATYTLPANADEVGILDPQGIYEKIDAIVMLERPIAENSWLIYREGQAVAAIGLPPGTDIYGKPLTWRLFNNGLIVQDQGFTEQKAPVLLLQATLYDGPEISIDWRKGMPTAEVLTMAIADNIPDAVAFDAFIQRLTTSTLTVTRDNKTIAATWQIDKRPELKVTLVTDQRVTERSVGGSVVVPASFNLNDVDITEQYLSDYYPTALKNLTTVLNEKPYILTDQLVLTAKQANYLIAPMFFQTNETGIVEAREPRDFSTTAIVLGRLIYEIDSDSDQTVVVWAKGSESKFGVAIEPGQDFCLNNEFSQYRMADRFGNDKNIDKWVWVGQFQLRQGSNTLILGPGGNNAVGIQSLYLSKNLRQDPNK